MNSPARRLLGWWLLALLVAAGFAHLGRWQLARMHEKEAILAAESAGEFDPKRLPSYGLYLAQGDLFYTDVKREDGKEVK